MLDTHGDKFSGCIRQFYLNDKFMPLTNKLGWNGWDITDCDGTACGTDVCLNDGSCLLNENKPFGFECECPEPYAGDHCQVHNLCEGDDGCLNEAACRVDGELIRCDCPFGWEGEKCQTGKLKKAHF